MTINKNTDLEFSLQQKTEKGAVYTNFYTGDKGSASIRIRLSSNESYLDLTKIDLKPVLFLFHEDGSIFEIKDFINVMPDKGLIQYNLSDNEIAHAGKVKAKLFLKNTEQSVHVANFTFDIRDSGIEGAVEKEISVNLVDDAVRRIIEENPDNFKGKDADPEEVKTLLEPYAESIAKQEFDKLSSAKQIDSEVITARGNDETLNKRLTNIQSGIGICANNYGASPEAEWTVNRNAFQQANDLAYANNGGTVYALPGTYEVKGIKQDSNVTFELKDVVLKSPDGLVPDVIATRNYSTTGSSVEGDNFKITVNDSKDIQVGTVIAIEGTGGILRTQQTTLSSPLGLNDTTINLVENDGKFPTNGLLRVDNELIRYSTIKSKVVTVTERGALGTVASTHTQSSKIGLAPVEYNEVLEKDGATLTLKDEVSLSVKNAQITFGPINFGVKSGVIDGNKVHGGAPSSVYGMSWTTARFGYIEHTVFKNCDHGGLIMMRGVKDSTIINPTFKDVGIYGLSSGNKGAGLWIFQGCQNNKVINANFIGSGWVGCYIDDRTTIANQYDKPNTENFITNFTVDFNNEPVGYNPGMVIAGSNRNIFTSGTIRGAYTGIKIERGSQYLGEPEDGSDNEFSSVNIDANQPWNVSSKGNRLNNIIYSDKLIAQPVTDDSTLVYAVSPSKGKSAIFGEITFPDGMPSKPSITFSNDRDTGIIRYGENTMGMVNNGQLTITLYNSLMRLKDGYTIETGTVNGTRIGNNPNNKIGFYGKTPIAQQTTLQNTSGYTLQQLEYEVNAIKNVLRNLGLVSG